MAGSNANTTASFESQEDWLDWIRDTKPAELKSIRRLALRLTDIDLSAVLSAPREPCKRQSSPSAFDLYQRELVRLDKGLAAMPGLSQIRIIPPRLNQSQLLRGMYLSFLKLLPKRYPKLRRLELADSAEVLRIVPELNQIAEVYCPQPGPTSSSRPEVAMASVASKAPFSQHNAAENEASAGGAKSARTRLRTSNHRTA